MLAGVGDENQTVPMVITMRVECKRCGHTESETYELDMPVDKAQPLEGREPGQCPECGAKLRIHLKRVIKVH
jgi:DNA-directed RNA polymerase subunit RPC12/RpoP